MLGLRTQKISVDSEESCISASADPSGNLFAPKQIRTATEVVLTADITRTQTSVDIYGKYQIIGVGNARPAYICVAAIQTNVNERESFGASFFPLLVWHHSTTVLLINHGARGRKRLTFPKGFTCVSNRPRATAERLQCTVRRIRYGLRTQKNRSCV
jgi:hypothetical protein